MKMRLSDIFRFNRGWLQLLFPRAVRQCHLLRDQSGSAVVELAIVVSLLGVPLLLGTGQMGLIVYDSIEVSNAAHVGAEYGMQSLTYASATSSIVAAARAEAADFGSSLTVTPTTYYACSLAAGGTQYTGTNAQANATAACTGGYNRALEFIQVNTSVAVTPLVRCPGLPTTYTLTGTSVMEVEQ
jgi:Flp pilus assembly protein TadG